MPKAMKKADWTARGEAYTESAEHLQLAWSDDPIERAQGDILTALFRKEAERCHRIAADQYTPK